ncbi:unnamed protein product [Larinioides sclopetarius]|uniref:Uncharacterized protein n=1 Tax=Larinioides sclopetarius TaxID=280406 RepID=A0AAV2B025_9ARAC
MLDDRNSCGRFSCVSSAKFCENNFNVGSASGMSSAFECRAACGGLIPVPGSKAARIIDSLPLTPVNYPKATQLLKERFRRDDLLSTDICPRAVEFGNEECHFL